MALRDEHGRAHPVMADVGCRNTVFGAEAQEASRHIDALRAAGIATTGWNSSTRPAGRWQVATAFADYGAGRLTAGALDQRLRAIMPEGTTQGSLFVPDDYARAGARVAARGGLLELISDYSSDARHRCPQRDSVWSSLRSMTEIARKAPNDRTQRRGSF